MRIIKFFLTYVIFFGVLAFVGFFIVREALLWVGISMIQSSISDMRAMSKNSQQYIVACKQKGSIGTGFILDHFQIRFTSARAYQVEAVCVQFPFDPVPVATRTLPPFVQKLPGSGGLIWGDDLSGVVLSIWGRERGIAIEQSEPKVQAASASIGVVTPLTTCEGYGYMCCDSEQVAGNGVNYTKVSDCPKTCFSQCIQRPVVLSFGSDPFIDPNTRRATVRAGEPMTFEYVISAPVTNQANVYIQYGDGESDHLTKLSGQSSHTYKCADNRGCTYTVSISATDKNGGRTANTSISTFGVNVAP